LAPIDLTRFKALSQNVQGKDAVPEAVYNKKFNRHLDVLPDPRTRVPVPQAEDGDETTAYYNVRVAAAQGPSGWVCSLGSITFATLLTPPSA